jgi:hypothetical protein
MTAKSIISPLLQSKIRHKQALTLPSVNAGKNPHQSINTIANLQIAKRVSWGRRRFVICAENVLTKKGHCLSTHPVMFC